MAITRTAWVDDDGTGTTGTVINNAVKTELYNQIDAADAAETTARTAAIAVETAARVAAFAALPYLGAWTQVAYAGGNFTAGSGMTWTVESGDQITYAYKKLDRTMLIMAEIFSSTIAGTPDGALRITVPGGFTIAHSCRNTFVYSNNAGVLSVGMAYAALNATYVALYKTDLSNWAAGTNNNSVYFQMFLETTA